LKIHGCVRARTSRPFFSRSTPLFLATPAAYPAAIPPEHSGDAAGSRSRATNGSDRRASASRGAIQARRPDTKEPARLAPSRRPPRALALAENDDHQQRMARPLQHPGRLEAEKPLDELESASQLDQRPQLLGEDHAREVRLAIHAARAVLDGLQRHVLLED